MPAWTTHPSDGLGSPSPRTVCGDNWEWKDEHRRYEKISTICLSAEVSQGGEIPLDGTFINHRPGTTTPKRLLRERRFGKNPIKVYSTA